MRLLALFLGNLQGPACVIQPAIARRIIKACHHNLPFFSIKPHNYVFIASEGEKEGREKTKRGGVGAGNGAWLLQPDLLLLHPQNQDPRPILGAATPWDPPNFQGTSSPFSYKTSPSLLQSTQGREQQS